MKPTLRSTFLVTFLCLVISAVALAQQASITLKNSDVAYCYKQDASWTLTKANDTNGQTVPSPTDVTWTITATKGATLGPKQLCAIGFVSVTNTGSAPATIGNIVVNLERNLSNKWTVVSSDMADATNGDAATTDKVVAAALQNQTIYPTGTVSGNTATFIENAYSGPLQFTDADNNTIWNITPQQTIAVGATVNLFFTAKFNADTLGLAPGEQLRTEVLVSFGNSGARGGSGSSANNIDINGNGVINTDEANVRTVPTRITRALPALQICNDLVTITDTFGTSGSAAVSINSDDIGSGVITNVSAQYLVVGTVSGSGTVSNTSELKGMGTTVTLTIGTDPITGLPITKDLPCCTALDLTANSSVQVEVMQVNYCSYTQGGFQGGGVPGQIYDTNFIPVFSPDGLTIGLIGSTTHDATWEANATGKSTLKSYLGGGGPSGALTADTVNATSTSGGTLAKQTAALTLNVAFGSANLFANPGIANLVLTGTGTSLDGSTVSQILGVANTALGSGVLPSGYSFGDLNDLIKNLNESWDNCTPSSWAATHLQ